MSENPEWRLVITSCRQNNNGTINGNGNNVVMAVAPFTWDLLSLVGGGIQGDMHAAEVPGRGGEDLWQTQRDIIHLFPVHSSVSAPRMAPVDRVRRQLRNEGEREGERQREAGREREGERQSEQGERQSEAGRERGREAKGDRETERDRERQRETETKTDRETERQREAKLNKVKQIKPNRIMLGWPLCGCVCVCVCLWGRMCTRDTLSHYAPVWEIGATERGSSEVFHKITHKCAHRGNK